MWQGTGGIRWVHDSRSIDTMLKYELPPRCGGNDIGRIPLGDLRHGISRTLEIAKHPYNSVTNTSTEVEI